MVQQANPQFSATITAKKSITQTVYSKNLFDTTPQTKNCTIPFVQLGFKTNIKNSELFSVITSKDFAEVGRLIFEDDTINWLERFAVVLLNKAQKVIAVQTISSGGIDGTVADTRIILQFALLYNAPKIALMHNHPSGNLKPSRADEDLTRKVREAARYLDIVVMDHVIVTDEGYYSFSDEGIL